MGCAMVIIAVGGDDAAAAEEAVCGWRDSTAPSAVAGHSQQRRHELASVLGPLFFCLCGAHGRLLVNGGSSGGGIAEDGRRKRIEAFLKNMFSIGSASPTDPPPSPAAPDDDDDVAGPAAGLEQMRLRARNTADGRQCAGCGRADAQLHRCARCKGAWYCSSDCQKQHWPQHQPSCAGAPAAAAAAAAAPRTLVGSEERAVPTELY
eukprot:gene32303-biopygen62576